MDIYSFFNSPDVAEHCKNIGHTFNAFESAVIINQCYTKSFDERISAYKAIISEYPDMEVPPVIHYEKHTESFHKVLEQIIKHEEQRLKQFLDCEQRAVYRVIFNNKNSDHSHHPSDIFSSYEKALSHALDYLKELNEAGEYDNYSYYDEILHMDIRKRYIDSDNYIAARISKSGSIMTIDDYCRDSQEEKELLYILDCYINVPTPFKNGDLVEYDRDNSFMGNIFVIQKLSHDSPCHESSIMKTDTSDMIAWVYYQSDGQVYCECMHFYPDLRYCKRELVGDERILKYVSLFVRDEICLCELLATQKLLLADKVRTEQIDNVPGNTISPDIHGLIENIKKG